MFKEQLQCCECKWWKQLNQLKAELQATKGLVTVGNKQFMQAMEKIEKLEAENEELKKKLDFQKNMYECARADESDKFEEILELKQALTEIKEIAEKIDDSDGCAYGDYDCDNCSSLEQETVCTYKVKKLILQKIRECEEIE